MSADAAFTGSIPELYDTVLVPMVFTDFSADLAAHVASGDPATVLETAAGTGALTRELHRILPEATITATDLNPAMLGQAAKALPPSERIRWQQADAQSLPFEDESFDAVVNQFGLMFVPDRARAYAEARRVLRPGGRLSAAVWSTLEDNEAALLVEQALASLFPGRPPRFFRRVPFAYNDEDLIRSELEAAGFSGIAVHTVEHQNAPASARAIAVSHVRGTPLANELSEGYGDLGRITEEVARLLEARFRGVPFAGKTSAVFLTGAA
jgi:ubiquinone/menaquinone biosynthesis C-methylase UbiE